MLLMLVSVSVCFAVVFNVLHRLITRDMYTKGVVYQEESYFRNIAFYIGLVVALFSSGFFFDKPVPSPFAIAIGLYVICVGTILTLMARASLAEQWVDKIGQQECHKLVSTGLYRRIRHPYYMGVLIINIGFGILAYSWIIAILAFLLFGSIIFRVEQEEATMLRHFGVEYEAYCMEVPMFFPKIKFTRLRRFTSRLTYTPRHRQPNPWLPYTWRRRS